MCPNFWPQLYAHKLGSVNLLRTVLLLISTPEALKSKINLHDVIFRLNFESRTNARSSCSEVIRFLPHLPLRCGVPVEPCCMFFLMLDTTL